MFPGSDLSICIHNRHSPFIIFSYKDYGYFEPSPTAPPCIGEKPFEASENIESTLKFFEMLGRAKHEPCGQFWETSYGESAWRLAILSLCLPDNVDRYADEGNKKRLKNYEQ